MDFIRRRGLLFVSVLLFAVSLFIRYRIRGWFNWDMYWMQGWYLHLYQDGWKGLADPSFSNYPPAYLYLLWFSTLFSRWLGPLISLKIIPTAFDFISMYVVFLMARMRYKDDVPYLLAAVFFILPTVMVNSSAWGQIDSMYTSFLLVCAYLLLKEKPFWALLAFGVAFSFKAQSIFLLPFLGIMFLKRKIAGYHFLVIPLVYVLLAFPAVLIGRSWGSILDLYVGQVDQFRDLAKNAPNLYMFIPNVYYDVGLKIGLALFAVCMAVWAWISWRSKVALTPGRIMLMALTSLALVPFLLPKMHDRYFYPADVFSFAAMLFNPEMWFVPLLYQLSSGLAYTIFLFKMPVVLVQIGAIINTFTVIYVVWKQLASLREPKPSKIVGVVETQ